MAASNRTTRASRAKRPDLNLVEVMPWHEDSSSRIKGVDGLTPKQRRFVLAMLGGAASASSAYREAYDTDGMSPRVVNNEASKLLHHRVIAVRLAEGFAEQERRALHGEVSRSRFVIERLTHEAEHATADASRVAALVALGRSCGMFTTKVQVDEPDQRTSAEIKADLERRLRELFGQAGV